MSTRASIDVLVLGAGPGALAIAAALGKENLRIEVLSASNHKEPWPYTYGIWGEEVDELGVEHLLTSMERHGKFFRPRWPGS